MTTFHRICIQDFTVTDGTSTASVTRGEEYITSAVRADGTVTVFSSHWFRVPVTYFTGEQRFTGTP